MEFIQKTIESAKSKKTKTLVFPESYDVRVIKAAKKITENKIAKVVLIGKCDEIKALAEKNNINMSGLEIVCFKNDNMAPGYVEDFVALRKTKGVDASLAFSMLSNPNNLHYAGMMLRSGFVDGCVAGAANSTGDVVRAAIQTVGLAPDIGLVSSALFLVTHAKHLGDEGVFLMADVAVNPNPDARQLAEIAVSSASTFESIIRKKAKVAMLSFSTKGSASHADVEKVKQATFLARGMSDSLIIDGELQFDSAVDPKSGSIKAPSSPVAGQANVLIFPDLDASNIGGKMPIVLYGAKPIGPLLQGLKKPFNDLSRSCSVDDIVSLAAMTCLQAEN